MSYRFFKTLFGVHHDLPLVYVLAYGLGNIVLQGLNWFWFFKIVSALRKRFEGDTGEHSKFLKSNGAGSNAVDIDSES